MIQIKGKPGLYKDPASGAIINADDSGYKEAKRAKKRILRSMERQEELEDRVDQLENLVKALLENKDETNNKN